MTLRDECLPEPRWKTALSGSEPWRLFDDWRLEAGAAETFDATAMTLATATSDGKPSARIVLLKERVDDSLLFYSDRSSRKGRELAENDEAALLFFWPRTNRQVRIEGRVALIDDDRSDAYFAGRDHGSQIGAWASRQSRALASRAGLADRVEETETRFSGVAVPRPPSWGGFAVYAERIEFWEAGPYRLHHRRLFVRQGELWDAIDLYP